MWLTNILRRFRIDSLKLGPVTLKPSVDRPAHEESSDESDKLTEFKQRFDEADIDGAFNLLLEGEDLLVTVIGQERYNSLQIGYALVQKAVAEAGQGEQGGDADKAREKRREANMYLGALKKRIRGIRYRA